MTAEHDLKQIVSEVLEQGYLVSLGICDESGPWVSDVIYIFDDSLNIYWMSDPDVRHSNAIRKNPQVAGTITVSKQGEMNLGIQFIGSVEKIEGPRFDLAKKHFAKRNKSEPKETDDVLQGDSWYMLRPKSIDIICERLFGFEKKKLEL